jgi:hypothetical protein
MQQFSGTACRAFVVTKVKHERKGELRTSSYDWSAKKPNVVTVDRSASPFQFAVLQELRHSQNSRE